MGHGIMKPDVISLLIDKYVNLEEDKCEAMKVSEKVLCCQA
jgi:hypothetical protein